MDNKSMNQSSNKEHKSWKRKIEGNKRLATVTNPLRNYIEKEIKTINVKEFPSRPQNKIDLSIGDPTTSQQFKTHSSNLQILKKNVGKIDGYTNFQGLQEARQTLANTFKGPNYKISKDNVFMTAGGSLALWASINLLTEEGDNYLFPSPGFPLSLVIGKSIGIQPRLYHLQPDKGWQASIAEMESLIDEKTKFVYVNDPSNPLGACWPQSHKKQIIQLCRKKNIPMITDQIYEGVTYEEPSKTFAEIAPEDVVIFKCSGLTKRWFGPGWRLGWLIVYGKQQVIKPYLKGLKGIFNVLLMPHTIMQASVKQIIQNKCNEDHLLSRLSIMRQNQHLIKKKLESEDYCLIAEASGALYATIVLKIQKFNETIPNCIEFCKKLYAEENIMIFPGQFFESKEPFVRLTISCATSIIKEFLERFQAFSRRHLK